MERDFGMLDATIQLRAGPFSIETLDTIASALQYVQVQGLVLGDWIDPARDHEIRSDNYSHNSNAWRFYTLPHTHRILHPGGGDERVKLTFLGLRPEMAGFILSINGRI